MTSKDEVAKFLLGHQYVLTALEFQQVRFFSCLVQFPFFVLTDRNV
jgi:hypothetical protein